MCTIRATHRSLDTAHRSLKSGPALPERAHRPLESGRGFSTRGIRQPLPWLSGLPFTCLVLASLVAVGCSRSDRPPLGRVGGTVTLDGAALAGALVVFTPDGPGRSALATTDSAGRYELSFLRDIAGANVGTHRVRITTATEDRGGKEILPDRYHVKTELTAKVESGTNTLDFPLQSK
jgi:hypothetical protein